MSDSTSDRVLNFKTKISSKETCKFIDIMDKIHVFFRSNMFCDITLIAKDSVFKIDAHKMVLSAASEYFLGMFGGSLREASEKEVKLDIDGPSLKSVINYIYTSSIELTTETVEDILITASLLELGSLKNICSEFIGKQLDPSNCVGIALFAEQYSLDELYKLSETFLCNNFVNIPNNEEFFKLDVYQLSKFLSSSDLRVDSEEDVYRILMLWIDHDKPKREEFMSKLLHHVRFSLLSPKFIASAIEPTSKGIECERQISKAYKWHLIPELRLSLYSEKQTQLRNFNGLVMAISGWETNGGTLNVGLYYPTLNDWIYKTGIPGLEIGRSDFGSTNFNGKLVIAGGILSREVTNRVDCLDLRTFEWSSLAPLNTKRTQFGMVTLNGCIYAVGGSSGGVILTSVEKYDPSTQEWKYVAAITNPSYKVHVSATLGKLCVSSLVPNHSEKYSHNLYDPNTDIWTNGWLYTTDHLIGTGTVSVFSNQFFIAVSKRSIMRYNNVIKSAEPIYIPKNSLRSECTKCKEFGGRMIAYGSNLFQEYNAFSNEWKMMPTFQNTSGEAILIDFGSLKT